MLGGLAAPLFREDAKGAGDPAGTIPAVHPPLHDLRERPIGSIRPTVPPSVSRSGTSAGRAGGAGRTSPCRGVGQSPTILPISFFSFLFLHTLSCFPGHCRGVRVGWGSVPPCRERFLKIVLAFSEKCAIIINVLCLFLQTTRWVFLPRARDSQGRRQQASAPLHVPSQHWGNSGGWEN